MINISSHFLSGVTFRLPGARIKELATVKLDEFTKMVIERKKRIAKIREEHKITDADLIDLLQQQASMNRRGMAVSSYTIGTASRMLGSDDDEVTAANGSVTTRSIQAGVVSAMEAEHSNMKSEEAAVIRLRRIINNIDTSKDFPVDMDDLEFLGL